MAEGTQIELRPLFEEPKDGRRADVTYDDIGGLGDTVDQIREMVELPLRHPELFQRLGIDPPKGVLLHGPPGTGKTRLARAVANETEARFFHIAGPEIMGSRYGESEQRLREVFQEAAQSAPSIIFIDEIDSIAPKREQVTGEVERRIVAQLLTLMDGLEPRQNIVVIGATNRRDAIDEALRRPGRFDREIIIGVPDQPGRREILGIHTRGMPLAEDVDLDEVARTTYGFVGADLGALVREAAMDAVRRILPEVNLRDGIPAEILEGLSVRRDDFLSAMKRIQPSALREIMIQVPDVTWDDVGDSPRPRCACARASSCRCGRRRPSAASASGRPRASSCSGHPAPARRCSPRRWRGSRTRTSSRRNPPTSCRNGTANPSSRSRACSNAPGRWRRRSSSSTRSTVSRQRGAGARRARRHGARRQHTPGRDGRAGGFAGVVVMAATNRPNLLDQALLRPGRFDELVYVPVPDIAGRRRILAIHTRDMPLAEDVDLDVIAERTARFTGADLEDLTRRAGLLALRESLEAAQVQRAHFEQAARETRPSVTPEMEREYEEMLRTLKQEGPQRQPIGFLSPR